MIYKILLLCFLLSSFGGVRGGYAQTAIEMDFPSCQHLQYHFALKQGNRLDTIVVGRIDEQGKASFVLPGKYTFHRGVGNLSIPFGNKNINLIINGEDKISLKEIDTDAQDVIISDSKENSYLKEQLAKQNKILSEYASLMDGDAVQSFVFALPEVRKSALEEEYKDYWSELDKSDLYASDMIKLLNLLSGFGTAFTQSQEEVKQNLQEYIVNELDFKDLYNSGFWNMALEAWCLESMTDDTLLVKQSQTMLDRTADIPTRRELTNELIKLFSKYAKDELLMEFGEKYLTIPINGKPAPDLVTGGVPIQARHALIIFYDSDCGFCRNELHQLKDKYELLSNDHNQMRVISVSGDTDKDMYEDLAGTFPWKDRLCDLKGFAGENFSNYGIVGSPTIVLVDKDGIVRGRYARLQDFLKY
ncbi:MAG: peroxiredoxin family protein [Dysgonomonas sp.]